ncbi:hypothetical protein [Mesorhizobium neociceri]|nr:hypothetical protein [Mesorhizobium neociceri]
MSGQKIRFGLLKRVEGLDLQASGFVRVSTSYSRRLALALAGQI